MKPVTPFDNYPSFGNAGSRSAPGDAKYALGFVPADTFPAEWANYFFHGATKGVSDLNTAVRSIWLELENILDAYGITADVSSSTQLLTAIGKIYPKMATCPTGASTQEKSIAVTGDVLKAGNVYVIDMTYGNTYGDGSSTYPTLSVNSGTAYPICDANGHYLASGAWAAGDTIKVLFTGSKYLMATRAVTNSITDGDMSPITSNAVYQFTSQIFDVIHPVGEVYVQFPGQKSPTELWGTLSTWEALNYQGAFFRADNGNAISFGTTLNIASQNGTTITFTTAHNLQSNAIVYDPVNNEGRTISSIVNSTTITVGAAFTHTDLTYLIPGQNAQNREHTHSANIRIYNTAGTQTGIGISTTSNVKYAFLSGYATISSEGGDEARSKNFTVKVWRRVS